MSAPTTPNPWPTGHTVFRRIPGDRLAQAQATTRIPARPGDAWWELVDAAVELTGSAAGVAVTRGRGADVDVVSLWTAAGSDRAVLDDVVRELVAALRRTDAGTITIRPDVCDPARLLSVLRDEDLVDGNLVDGNLVDGSHDPRPAAPITIVL